MTWLDATTMSAVTALVMTVCCVVFLIDTFSFGGNAAARLWAVAFSTGVLTAFAYMVWTFLPGAWMAVAAGNASFVASVGFLWLGCRRFNRPDLRWAGWALGLAVAATFLAAAVRGPGGGDWAGAAFMFAAIAAAAGLATHETRRAPLADFRTSLTLTVVMAATCLYYVLRTAVFVTVGPESELFTTWFGTPSTSVVTIVLSIVAVTTMVMLRIHDQAEAGARGSTSLTLGADGFLDRTSFQRFLATLLERGEPRRSPTSVIALAIDDLGRIAAAFGSREAERISTLLRTTVAEVAPTSAILGSDGDSRAMLCLPGTSSEEALRTARRLSQTALERLHALETPAVPVLGVGVASAAVGNDAGAVVGAAATAAATSAANADGAVVLSVSGEAVADAADRLDPPR